MNFQYTSRCYYGVFSVIIYLSYSSYYGPNGNQYNMIRVPIGGTDFSTHAYAYNEVPENDAKLSNYSLAYEDYEYKVSIMKISMITHVFII